ncbi:lipid-A-disaccharide synthase N-terminal domain-containing protein [Arvimicrobium flavum]|uniref:lipid-A-disaccharide synthase N-terminal domain-containing protein n=1 Tax=Arvimicrobium flavum TaxID=3393320 RepID=UPI00237A3AF1|nr:lipid-A-disaccharide synthase N-terminal domain-containing protein [Mesorhizobium shangrilense]
MTKEMIWLGIGFLGQAMFSMRFLVQWIASERIKRSVIPHAFWYFSLFGGLTLLSYAIYRLDPVFIIGQATGLFIYIRNLMLLRNQTHSGAEQAS